MSRQSQLGRGGVPSIFASLKEQVSQIQKISAELQLQKAAAKAIATKGKGDSAVLR
jgi:hypothetical protein